MARKKKGIEDLIAAGFTVTPPETSEAGELLGDRLTVERDGFSTVIPLEREEFHEDAVRSILDAVAAQEKALRKHPPVDADAR